MIRVRTFQALVLVHFAVSLALQFRPFGDWFLTDSRGARILEYDGYASIVNAQSPIFSTLPFLLLFLSTIGLVFLRNWGRYLFLSLVVAYWISSPLFGLRVNSPFDGLLGSPLGPLSGAILALAFWSPLAQTFVTKSSNGPPAP